MRRYLITGLLSFLALPWFMARAEILPGDVAIVRMNNSGSPDDNFSVLALKALDASDVLFWTDNGWTLTNTFRTGEGAGATDIITNSLAAGTVINVPAASLSASGDQLFLFTNTVAAPKLMFAVDWGSAQGWDADGTTTGTSADPTTTVPPVLPPELAVSLGSLRAYIYTGTLVGTKAELLASISNVANWAAADAANSNAWDRGSFDVQSSGGVVTNPPVLASLGSQSVVVSNMLQFSVTATPTEGDLVTLSMSNAPAEAVLGTTNELGTFTWMPTNTGVFTVDFYAADDDGVDSESVTITVSSAAAATEVAGKIAVVQVNGDATDFAYIVALEAIPAGASIWISDNEWNETTPGFADLNESEFNFTFVSGASAGEVVVMTNTASFSGSGEELYLMTNQPAVSLASAQAGFMFAISWGSDWAANEIPAPLANYNVGFSSGAAATYTGALTGTKAELLALLTNKVNWTTSATAPTPWNRGNFTVSGGVSEVPPTLNAIGNQSVMVSNLLSVSFSATPTDGDLVTLSVSNAPAGLEFGATNENGVLNWTPTVVGVYTVSVYAADNDGVDSETFSITVNEVPSESPRAGDLAVVQISGVTNDFTYVVALTNFTAGTTIYATDKEWAEAVPGFTSGEDAFAFTFPADVSVGDVFPITNVWSFASTGEEFYLLTNNPAGLASAAQAGFIFAISWGADWAAGEIPSTLTNHQVGLTGGGAATYTGTLVGTRAELIAQITNDINWVVEAVTPAAWSRGNFTVSGTGNPNDTDEDGLPDSWETDNFGTTTNQAGGDVDEDGSPNVDEFIANTQPTNDASFFRASVINPAGGAAIGFTGATGRFYSVDYLEDLHAQPQSWSNLFTGMAGTNGLMTINDSAATNARVYRIGVKLSL